MKTKNVDLFIIFSGSMLAILAYFFVGSSSYSLLTTIGGGVMLLPLVFRFLDAQQLVVKIPLGRIATFSLIFSGGVSYLWFLDRGIHSDPFIIGDIYQFALSILFLCVGFSVDFSEKVFSKICIFYGLWLSVLGFLGIKYLGGGFDQISDTYVLGAKNSLCVGWAVAGAILFWLFFYGYKTQFLKWVGVVAFVGILLCILYARGRTAFCALIAFCCVVLCKRYGRGSWVLGVLVCIFFAIGFYVYVCIWGIPQVLTDSFFKNKDVDDLNDISSGRIDLILMGLNGFLSYPLWGGGDLNSSMAIHCYPIRVLSSRGILGSFGYLLFYFSLWMICAKEFFRKKAPLPSDVGIYLMIVLLVDSLGEVTMPFGPGTISAHCFILFGATIKKRWVETHSFFKSNAFIRTRNNSH